MSKSEKRRRNNVITFRVTDHELECLTKAAEHNRKGNISEFVRDAAYWYSMPWNKPEDSFMLAVRRAERP